MQDPFWICHRQAILYWARPSNPERSSLISQILHPTPLFSEIWFTGSAIGGQLAGGGNIAIRRRIAASRPRVRRPSTSGSQLLQPIFVQESAPAPTREGRGLFH
jgi:hypothetical protein